MQNYRCLASSALRNIKSMLQSVDHGLKVRRFGLNAQLTQDEDQVIENIFMSDLEILAEISYYLCQQWSIINLC